MNPTARSLYEHALRHAAWSVRARRGSTSARSIEALVMKIGAELQNLDPELDEDRRIAARLFEALALCEYARGTGPRPLVLDMMFGEGARDDPR